ncbi:ABC transporter substrate-binding protein [Desulfovibrio sp. MES5]|uniref:ABC transporter substrate-binding protein n=1 Tax=Desulfovibrio sp. MES5 TaxID=1899016 RepID=UPI0025C5071C|nr:ABC transporter substrate-binding protein [Desulfovibrio sp. MES5]
MQIRFLALGPLVLLALLVMPCRVSAAEDSFAASESGAAVEDARSVYCATPPSTFTLYAFAPELLAGWNTPLRDYEKKFIPVQYHNLPVLGGWYGQGFIPDREMLLASGIKKAFYLSMGPHDRLPIEQTLTSLGMKVTSVPGSSLADMAPCFLAMGRAFGREERGAALAAYASQTLEKVSRAMRDLPKEKWTKVYVALEADGLASICRQSQRADVFAAAGAQSVHDCPPGAEEAFLRVTFEQLMAYNPEVILVFHPALMRRIPTDPKWAALSAVRQGKVYFMPRGPFSWLERPATYMRLLGVQWLANKLHPDLYPVDINVESKHFMKLFFNLDLDDTQVNNFFEPYGTF